MGSYNRGGGFNRRDDRGFGGGRSRGGFRRNNGGGFGNRDDRQMFEAVCDNCGKACRVPFQPTQGKPVYCSQCFEDKGNGNNSNSRNCDCKGYYEALNAKLDKIIAILTPKAEETKSVEVKKVAKKETSVKES